MKKNSNEIEGFPWSSPEGKFVGAGKEISEALRWNRQGDARADIPLQWRDPAYPGGSDPLPLPLTLGAMGVLPTPPHAGMIIFFGPDTA